MQRDQIAVLKAFGYRNAHRRPALPRAGARARRRRAPSLGTALGLWLADALAGVYARFFQFPDARFVPQAGGGRGRRAGRPAARRLLGALGAVRQALALPPAEAMRPEAPAVFRPSLLERSGLGKRLPLAARIIVRHLHRRPWKAALAVLGTGFAVAIVFTGQDMWDAIEVLKEVQFEHVQRAGRCCSPFASHCRRRRGTRWRGCPACCGSSPSEPWRPRCATDTAAAAWR